MKHPEVFGSLYIMSPCCMSARTAGGGAGAPGGRGASGGRGGPGGPASAAAPAADPLAAVRTTADAAKLPFGLRTQLASAAAWSPNPKRPPLYLDLPSDSPDVLSRWAANAPLAFVDQYIGNLKQYKAIAMDVGDRDGLRVDAGKLHDILDNNGVANSFEIYPGDHTSAVADRFQNHVLPFFGRNLCSGKGCK